MSLGRPKWMDLPPSGVSSRVYDAAKTIYEDENTDIVTISGIGSVNTVELFTGDENGSHLIYFTILVDDERVFYRGIGELFLRGFGPDTRPVSLILYAEDGYNWITINIPYQFRDSFKVQALSQAGTQIVAAWVYVTKPR